MSEYNEHPIFAIDEATKNILREIIGSALFFSTWSEFAGLMEEKLKVLSGWELVKVVEYNISRECFVNRDITGAIKCKRILDFYSPNSPVIQTLQEIEGPLARKIETRSNGDTYEKVLIRDGYRWAYLAPIMVRDKFLGIVACFSKNEEGALPKDVSMLEVAAEILSISQEMHFYRKKFNEFHKKIEKLEENLIGLEADRMVAEFSSNAFFNINGILTGIVGQLEMLEKQISDPQALQTIEEMKNNAVNGRENLRELEEMRKVSLVQEMEKLDPGAVVKKAVELTSPKWRDEAWAKNTEYRVEMDLAETPEINGNKALILHSFMNAVLKAMESIPNGGRINIQTFAGQNINVQITAVRGAGHMSMEALGNPFMTDSVVQEYSRNMDLIKEIMKRHNGKFEMEVKMGGGIKMKFEFPPVEAEPEEMPALQDSHIKNAVPKILVVEDDPSVRMLLENLLKLEGYQVVLAAKGETAIELLGEAKFDLMFTDLGMPGMSGYQLSVKVRDIDPSLPIIMITGWESRLDRDKMDEFNIDYIMAKPFLFSEVIEAIEKSMSKRKAKTAQAFENDVR
ncbi:MAG: response regulator [Firmicutes bacterium]|nr:response regulator [Bacillota bacterium]